MTLLAAEKVGRTYRNGGLLGRGGDYKTVLSEVSLSLAAGESLALLGPSGSGKSTLARLLLGLESPSSGRITFRNQPLQGLRGEDWQAFRRAVQVVFQDSLSAVNPRHRVGRIVAEPLRHLTKLNPAQQAARVAEVLELVGLSPEDADKLPGQMSGGQVQRVCIARALAPEPAVIILDEAVSNLDLVMQIQVLDLLASLRRLGTAFVFITHDLRLVPRLCDRVAVLEEGRIVEEQAVTRGFRLSSDAGRRLQEAVLPARPRG
ncbi:nickel import ATP-binding protein NikE [Telmatospirillum sp. J64-1]|uniref:nickel import ATP-binding protein NikE n=1 Tax=Telmatospirillum sp. J64-1 TaxID=2502183 RepID=UPI00115D74D0|nr:nickel import ATP-binding protein NikE [Telmatospirillum sp. J64-1]